MSQLQDVFPLLHEDCMKMVGNWACKSLLLFLKFFNAQEMLSTARIE
jgi:hypothetical protein